MRYGPSSTCSGIACAIVDTVLLFRWFRGGATDEPEVERLINSYGGNAAKAKAATDSAQRKNQPSKGDGGKRRRHNNLSGPASNTSAGEEVSASHLLLFALATLILILIVETGPSLLYIFLKRLARWFVGDSDAWAHDEA